MIVCICRRVNSIQIRDAVQNGANDLDSVTQELGLGTGCGRCVEFAERMINKELLLLATEVEVA